MNLTEIHARLAAQPLGHDWPADATHCLVTLDVVSRRPRATFHRSWATLDASRVAYERHTRLWNATRAWVALERLPTPHRIAESGAAHLTGYI